MVNELWKDNDQLCERQKYLEDRSRRDNLRIDGLDEVENQKQPSRGVLNQRFSENIQQIYRRSPKPKCDLNKVAQQLY